MLLHADLQRVDMTKIIRLQVPVHVKGESAGVKNDGGVLDIVMREVEIECLPADIPDAIVIDVTNLGVNQAIRVSDLAKDSKVKFLSDAELTVVHVTTVKEEAATAEAVEAVAEPEVMKKGKPEAAEGDAKKK